MHVAINGTDTAHGVPAVGTVPAALTTYAAIAELSPDLIINAGTAGGFAARGAKVGDIYLSSAVCARMRRHVRACSRLRAFEPGRYTWWRLVLTVSTASGRC